MGRRNTGEPEKIGEVVGGEVGRSQEIRGCASRREENNCKSMDRGKLVHLHFVLNCWWRNYHPGEF